MGMTNDAPSSSAEVFSFGPFQLLREQRELREAGRPVRLGNRALEILIALIEQPGVVVGKKALLDRVWPNKTVEEASLRVHIAALRKTLGDGRSGVRYVENFSGRGYRFLAPVTRLRGMKSLTAAPVEQSHRRRNLPLPLARMLGRMQFVRSIVTRLPQRRFVTIAGSGGIGKTTVALTVAHSLVESYPHGAHFVDLASLADPRRVPETFASSLGISAFSDDPMPGILAFVKDKGMLIVLDSCEHVIEAAASLAEKVLKAAPNVHLLVTSREPLRAEGEWVHRLLPLETPSQGASLSRTEALTFPAVQLFVEHATASLDTFTLEDADVPIVAEICRGL
jgi:DNA-binding winged helix-turn-helix (wHTH) protein